MCIALVHSIKQDIYIYVYIYKPIKFFFERQSGQSTQSSVKGQELIINKESTVRQSKNCQSQ